VAPLHAAAAHRDGDEAVDELRQQLARVCVAAERGGERVCVGLEPDPRGARQRDHRDECLLAGSDAERSEDPTRDKRRRESAAVEAATAARRRNGGVFDKLVDSDADGRLAVGKPTGRLRESS